MLNKTFSIYCLLLLCILNVDAQVFKYIGMEDGLSSRRVLSIQQGSQDYMWILTHKGVDRFDGKHFNHYTLLKNGKAVIFYPNLNQLIVDENNVLWEYGKDGLVFCYNEQKDSFQLVFNARKEYGEINHSPINCTYFDSKNTIWFSCGKKVILFDTKTLKGRCIKEGINEDIICITEGKEGIFYFTTGKSIYRVKFDDEMNFKSETINIDDLSVISYIYYHKETDLLVISTLLNGLYIYDPSTSMTHDLGNYLNDVNINTIKPYYKNPFEVLIATDGDGVYKLNLKNHFFTHFLKEDNDKPNKMNGSIIKDICIDKSNRIWNVIYPTGITIYSEQYNAFEWIKRSNNNSNSLVDDRINGIMEDSYGDVWFATSNGISCYNIKEKTWKNYFSRKDKDSYNNNHIFISLCEYKPGYILAGGYMSGMYLINKNTGKINYFTQSINTGKYPDKYIRSIIKDSEGTIWRGGFYSLRSYSHTTNKTRTYTTAYPITCLKEKDENSIWVGTINGLFILDKKKDKMEEFKLPSQAGCINAIYQTDEGNITYVGTYGNGLFLINNKTNEKRHYYIDNSGLITNNIYCLAPNKFGDILIGTENGLSLFEPDQEIFTNWTKEQGLTASNFNQNASIRTDKGYLFFGSNNGVIVLSDSIKLPRQFTSHMIFDNLSIMYKTVHPNEPGSPLTKNLNETSEIELEYDQNTFSMNVASINYDNPSNIYYSWKLEGFFDKWTEPSENNSIKYTNLSPGEYNLKVRAMLLDNKQLLEERSIRIIVHRPFWLTIWAFLFYIILIIGTTFAIVRYKIIKRDRRTSQEKINFFMHTAHDIRTPLTLIKAPLGEILKKEHLSDEGVMNINLAIQNTDNLSELANKLMNFQKEELYSSKVTVCKMKLNAYIKEYLNQFHNYAEQKEISLSFESSFDELDVWIDRNKMDPILRNLLTNALKYTPKKGKVSVKTERSRKNWMVTISDTGIGISKKDQKKLFKYLFRGSNATNQLITGSGIGMLLTWRLIHNHKGRISFSSSENTGTSFNLTFPINHKQYIYKDNSICDINDDSVFDTGLNDNSSLLPILDINKKKADENAPYVLIVEDNNALRNFLVQSLSDNYRAEGVVNGEEALETVQKKQPDLIISDIMMPVMNGYELCRRIKGNVNTSHIPFIMLTALGDKKDIISGLETKADLYIVKPFDLMVLKANISNILENRDLLREKLQKLIISIPQSREKDDETSATIEETPQMMSQLDEEFIQKVTGLIRDGLGNGLNVDTLCAAVNMSRTSFYTKIKGLTGASPAEMIREIRMKESAILLKTHKYTVSEVSDMMGFADPKYFTDTFKKHYRVPPSVYMKSQDNESESSDNIQD